MKQPATWKLLLAAFILMVASGGVAFWLQWSGLRAEFATRVPERPVDMTEWGPEFAGAESRALAGNVDGLSDLGGYYQLAGYHEEALYCFEGAVARDPQNAERLLLVAKLQAVLGQHSSAEHNLNRAIQLGFAEGWFWGGVGEVWQLLSKPIEALEEFNRAVQLDPTLDGAWHQLYLIHRSQKDDELSVKTLDAGLAVNPDSVQLLIDRGGWFSAQEQWDEALVAFERTIEVDPKCIDAYFGAAVVLMRDFREKEVSEYLTAAWEIEPKNQKILSLLCIEAMRFWREDDALRWFAALDELPEFSPNDRSALRQLFQQQFGEPLPE